MADALDGQDYCIRAGNDGNRLIPVGLMDGQRFFGSGRIRGQGEILRSRGCAQVETALSAKDEPIVFLGLGTAPDEREL